MRKTIGLVSLVAMSLMFSLAAFAQMPANADNSTEVKTEGAGGKCPLSDKGMMKGDFMGHMMMNKMMTKQLVATSDGGVVILMGNKIIKYDRNLKLVKETEISMDGMKAGMMEKKWHHHHMNKGDKEEANEAANAQGPQVGNDTAAQQ
jgi:hypothetical protein